jgi:hypothetical protein
MRSIVTEGLDPADRAGGVAYLWVTLFAAGQALAVPRQQPTIDRHSHVAFTGTQPHANWGRACPPMYYEVV